MRDGEEVDSQINIAQVEELKSQIEQLKEELKSTFDGAVVSDLYVRLKALEDKVDKLTQSNTSYDYRLEALEKEFTDLKHDIQGNTRTLNDINIQLGRIDTSAVQGICEFNESLKGFSRIGKLFLKGLKWCGCGIALVWVIYLMVHGQISPEHIKALVAALGALV